MRPKKETNLLKMADNEEGEETTSRGNEWEVVSLTASAYAAAPGPKGIEMSDDGKSNTFKDNEAETPHAMFMSGHFVFPPSQHENLPLEPEDTEIHNEHGSEDVIPESNVEKGGHSDGKNEDNWSIKDLTKGDEFPGIQLFDEGGKSLSDRGKGFEEGAALKGLNLVDKEPDIYSAAKFSSFHSEPTIGGSTTYDGDTVIPDLVEPPELGADLHADISQSPKSTKDDDRYDGSNLPCEAWWKRRAASFYGHAKEANTFWSIFIAAAVMGLVILGQRWQHERWQVLQLKWQFGVNDEKMGRMLGPIIRLKDVLVGGNRRGSFIRGSSTSGNR
ncbi:hypothetical protein PVL29_020354 [Vitis rotundifolia]|uniref:ATG8-interacting protein 1 n=2 Tax=Vitis rotundifolia TaxID=103349 RepID=A0AA38Z397_VITRO|nr:hypothetical protein PVL29_020354 [Vitis rotundifolia]